ncbi:MAG: hypothetical protein EOP32_21370 [Rhodococcus sp. (in: high G+C Gram-positive bacteria)]|nr:MAG: hypothetical protein EOP32_21370 [Rhodococcus sp. (in: high G+C Gram-positive bacteria)]
MRYFYDCEFIEDGRTIDLVSIGVVAEDGRQSLPRYTRELRQYWEENGSPALPPAPGDAHDALADARHNLAKFEAVQAARSLR